MLVPVLNSTVTLFPDETKNGLVWAPVTCSTWPVLLQLPSHICQAKNTHGLKRSFEEHAQCVQEFGHDHLAVSWCFPYPEIFTHHVSGPGKMNDLVVYGWRYGDGAGNTTEKNSSVFTLIRMRQLPSVLWHCWLGGRKGVWPVKKNGMMVEVGTG